MARYKLSAEAKKDLQEIAKYTKETWGIDQAEKYICELRKAIYTIAHTPQIGRLREELAHGLRSFKADSYIIFYKEHKNGIVVARILHSKRDVKQELG